VVSCQNRVLVEADHYERSSQLEKAEIFLRRHLETHPSDAEVHFRLGELHGRTQRYEQMLQDFAAAEEHDGRLRDKIANRKEFYWRENFNRGAAALNRDEPPQAVTPLRHATLILPERHAAYPLLAAALLASPDSSGVTSVLEKACALNDGDLESRHALLQLYYAAGRDHQALQLSEEILKKSSRDLSALRCRALVLQQLQPDEAEAAFRELLRRSDDANDLLALALYYHRRERYEQAGPLFREALDRRGQASEATEGALVSSTRNYPFAIRLGGKRPLPIEEIYRYLGDCAWHLGDYAAMSEWYTRLLQARPNDKPALQNLFIAVQALGKQDDAELIKKQLDQLTSGQE
jgi:tetratricopeptide (TPR) repeat protein